MRYAVLSDVHGNVWALRAVLDALDGTAVDGYLVLGDLVGYGPRPNECIEVLQRLDAVCVAGNHDLLALGALPVERSGALARRTLDWTSSVLTADSRSYLAALPRRRVHGQLVLAHGSLDDPEEYVTTGDRARELLDRAGELAGDCRALLLGHTHHAWGYARGGGTRLRRAPGAVRLDPRERYLLNPGSVGQSRDRTLAARFAVVDLDAGVASFHSVAYDAAACRAALVAAGLPPTAHQLLPTWAERRHRVLDSVRDRVRSR